MTTEERILALEAATRSSVPGTQLQRVLNPAQGGVQWCLGLGGLTAPKEFFYGPTIDAVLTKAETVMAYRQGRGQKPVVTVMDQLTESLERVTAKRASSDD